MARALAIDEDRVAGLVKGPRRGKDLGGAVRRPHEVDGGLLVMGPELDDPLQAIVAVEAPDALECSDEHSLSVALDRAHPLRARQRSERLIPGPSVPLPEQEADGTGV